LKIPNELFYDDDLVSSAGDISNSMLNWALLPNSKFPIIFDGIEGQETREGNSPSWFNPSEAEKVFKYVQDLVLNKNNVSPVTSKDIGIITPYQRQALKIRKLLENNHNEKNKFKEIQVGSCEQFQGQERRIIILSTVRSSTDFLDSDKFFNLGFVSNPKRFNVAVTRAKALLIVVGNPHILKLDPCWRRLLEWCKDNNSCIGTSFSLPTGGDEKVNELALKLDEILISDYGSSHNIDERVEGAPWRADI
jgi:helicase MOV-10